MTDEELSWREIDREFIEDYKIFQTFKVRRESFHGKKGDFYEVHCSDWVTVIPRDAEGSILMVKQFRMGSGALSLEFPAGVVEKGEAPLNAAKRELKEETGVEANKWTLLGKVNPNPAFMTNRSWTFLAEDLSEAGETNWDEHESMESLWMEEDSISRALGRGDMDSAIMVQAWYWYQSKKKEIL